MKGNIIKYYQYLQTLLEYLVYGKENAMTKNLDIGNLGTPSI